MLGNTSALKISWLMMWKSCLNPGSTRQRLALWHTLQLVWRGSLTCIDFTLGNFFCLPSFKTVLNLNYSRSYSSKLIPKVTLKSYLLLKLFKWRLWSKQTSLSTVHRTLAATGLSSKTHIKGGVVKNPLIVLFIEWPPKCNAKYITVQKMKIPITYL